MKILIISQHFYPDFGAVSFRMKALADSLHENGHQVFVLSATPNRYNEFSNYQSTFLAYSVDRVLIKKRKKDPISRVISFFDFYKKTMVLKKKYKKMQIDLIISTTPNMLEGLVGLKFAKYLKCKNILDVRDLWPDTPVALGAIKKNGLIEKILKHLEKRIYDRADWIIVTSPGYISHINAIVKNKGIDVVLNGIDEEFLNVKEALVPKKKKLETDKKIQILYAGNIGVAQNLLTLVKAASYVQDKNFKFTLVGAGSQLDKIKQMISSEGIDNVEVVSPVSRDSLISYYSNADALYLHLDSNDYFKKVIPSKIFEYLAFNKPIIYGVDGVSKDLLEKYQGTYYHKPDDVDALVSVLINVNYDIILKRDIENLNRKRQVDMINVIIKKVFEEKL